MPLPQLESGRAPYSNITVLSRRQSTSFVDRLLLYVHRTVQQMRLGTSCDCTVRYVRRTVRMARLSTSCVGTLLHTLRRLVRGLQTTRFQVTRSAISASHQTLAKHFPRFNSRSGFIVGYFCLGEIHLYALIAFSFKHEAD